ncbi:hypothetical protein NKDENANG_03972 [Candidatus Entotheonellaceae bacterium PAL068K]
MHLTCCLPLCAGRRRQIREKPTPESHSPLATLRDKRRLKKGFAKFRSLIERLQAFDTEEKCISHLAALRWPDGTVCPHCSSTHRHPYIASRRVWWFKSCKKQFSVKVGTIFGGNPIKLQKWFMAVWLLTSHNKGISSHKLARDIHVTQKTAWFILSRLRLVAKRMGQSGKLFGIVEALRARGLNSSVASSASITRSAASICSDTSTSLWCGRTAAQWRSTSASMSFCLASRACG